jgi:hypothetical protein
VLTEREHDEVSLILEIAGEEGLAVALTADGRPCVTGGRPSDRLMAFLRGHRDLIIARLTPWRCREWLWPDGMLYREEPTYLWLYGRADRHPIGARKWRLAGEKDWRAVPGRGAS